MLLQAKAPDTPASVASRPPLAIRPPAWASPFGPPHQGNTHVVGMAPPQCYMQVGHQFVLLPDAKRVHQSKGLSCSANSCIRHRAQGEAIAICTLLGKDCSHMPCRPRHMFAVDPGCCVILALKCECAVLDSYFSREAAAREISTIRGSDRLTFVTQGVDPTNGCVWGTPAAGVSQAPAYMNGWGFSPQPMLSGSFLQHPSTSDLHKCPSVVSLPTTSSALVSLQFKLKRFSSRVLSGRRPMSISSCQAYSQGFCISCSSSQLGAGPLKMLPNTPAHMLTRIVPKATGTFAKT